MGRKRPPRWTREEDRALVQAWQAAPGNSSGWRRTVLGRTPKAHERRLSFLTQARRAAGDGRHFWTADEDRMLLSVARDATQYRKAHIATDAYGLLAARLRRTPKACERRLWRLKHMAD